MSVDFALFSNMSVKINGLFSNELSKEIESIEKVIEIIENCN